MKKLFGKLVYAECDCHPLPSFGPFKRYKLDYLKELMMPMFGTVMIELARPNKGIVAFGVWIKAFGGINMFLPLMGKKK